MLKTLFQESLYITACRIDLKNGEPWRNLLLNQARIYEGQNEVDSSGYYVSD